MAIPRRQALVQPPVQAAINQAVAVNENANAAAANHVENPVVPAGPNQEHIQVMQDLVQINVLENPVYDHLHQLFQDIDFDEAPDVFLDSLTALVQEAEATNIDESAFIEVFQSRLEEFANLPELRVALSGHVVEAPNYNSDYFMAMTDQLNLYCLLSSDGSRKLYNLEIEDVQSDFARDVADELSDLFKNEGQDTAKAWLLVAANKLRLEDQCIESAELIEFIESQGDEIGLSITDLFDFKFVNVDFIDEVMHV